MPIIPSPSRPRPALPCCQASWPLFNLVPTQMALLAPQGRAQQASWPSCTPVPRSLPCTRLASQHANSYPTRTIESQFMSHPTLGYDPHSSLTQAAGSAARQLLSPCNRVASPWPLPSRHQSKNHARRSPCIFRRTATPLPQPDSSSLHASCMSTSRPMHPPKIPLHTSIARSLHPLSRASYPPTYISKSPAT